MYEAKNQTLVKFVWFTNKLFEKIPKRKPNELAHAENCIFIKPCFQSDK